MNWSFYMNFILESALFISAGFGNPIEGWILNAIWKLIRLILNTAGMKYFLIEYGDSMNCLQLSSNINQKIARWYVFYVSI